MIRSTRGLRVAALTGLVLTAGIARAVAPGDAAPAVSAAGWHNTTAPLDLAGLRGKVVLIDFWGVWCTPCLAQMPKLVRLQSELGERGFVVLTVHTPLKADRVGAYLERERVPLVVAVDTGKTAAAYGISNYPAYFLIDADGIVADMPSHAPDRATVERLLDRRDRRN